MARNLSYWFWRIVLVSSTFFAIFKLAAILGFGLKGVAIWTTWVYMLLGLLVGGFAYTRLRKVRRRECTVEKRATPLPLTEPASGFNADFNDGKERVEIWK